MSDISISDCTILIYTYNRPEFLRRSLEYWKDCDVKILVADGSDEPYSIIPENTKYIHCPGKTIVERIRILVNKVDTNFAVFVADDDFIGFEALERSVEFLKRNNDYSSVQGLYTRFWTLKSVNKVISEPNDYNYSKNYNWNSDCYANRLVDVNKHKVMHYCYSVVTRSTLSTLINLFEKIDKNLGNTFFEPLMAYAAAIEGKIKIQKYFYCARQVQVQDWRGIVLFENLIKNNDPEYVALLNNVVSICKNKYQEDDNKAYQIALDAGQAYLDAIEIKEKSIANNQQSNNKIFQFYSKYKNIIKIYFQMLGIMKNHGVDIDFFDGDGIALQSYNRDWARINKVLLEVKVSKIKY